MNILFIIDRIELKYFEFNNLVTNFWLIREMLRENNSVFITTIDKLSLVEAEAYTHCYEAYEKNGNIFYDKQDIHKKIEDFQLVMFRQDPPVDMDYINSTYIFDFVDRRKTLVMNEPRAIRDFNEKLHALKFLEFMPENIVTSSKSDITEFLEKNGEIVLKPLNRCFGAGVMCLKKGDKKILRLRINFLIKFLFGNLSKNLGNLSKKLTNFRQFPSRIFNGGFDSAERMI